MRLVSPGLMITVNERFYQLWLDMDRSFNPMMVVTKTSKPAGCGLVESKKVVVDIFAFEPS